MSSSNTSNTNRKELSQKEQEILNRQRALATARKVPPPPPPSLSSSSSLKLAHNKSSSDEAYSTTDSADYNSRKKRKRTDCTGISKNNNNAALLGTRTCSTGSIYNENHTSGDGGSSSIANWSDKKHIVIDLTDSSKPSIQHKSNKSSSTFFSSNNTVKPPPPPPCAPPPPPPPPSSSSSSKRPTLRKHHIIKSAAATTTSKKNIEQVIAASRSRVAATTNNTNNATMNKSLSSLLSKAGINEQQLQTKIKHSSSYQNNKKQGIMKRRSKSNHDNNDSNDDNYDDNEYDNDNSNNLTLDMYFNHLLQWDFVHSLNKERMKYYNLQTKKNISQQSQLHDQQNNKDDEEDDDNDERETIPDIFKTRKQYQSLWAPLLIDEAKAQIISDVLNNNNNDSSSLLFANQNVIPVLVSPQSKDVGSHNQTMTVILQPNHTNNIISSQNVNNNDSYCHYKATYDNNNNNNIDNSDNNRTSFMSNDLVLIAKDTSILIQACKGKLYPSNTHSKHHEQSKTICGSCLGLVEYSRKSVEGLPIKIQRKFWSQLSTGKKEEELVIIKLGCNITSIREFTALCRVGTLPLLPYLLCKKMTKKAKDSMDELSEILSITTNDCTSLASSSGIMKKKDGDQKLVHIQNMGGKAKLGEGFTNYAQHKFNTSQLGAISAAASEYGRGGFTLIKGPPGTGKTTTLVAVLNALHIRQMNKYYEKVKEIIVGQNTMSTGQKKVALEEAQKGIPRVLVCAPSNNAIDNVILQIMEQGFIDGHGSKYYPSIIRIGVGQSANVKNVSLEYKVQNLMNEAKDFTKIQNAVAGYKSELSHIQTNIGELKRRQFAIVNASPWPLSKDWEIRCDTNFEESNRVYFVNHKEKSTTYENPPPPEPGESHYPATSMPEYRTATQQLVKLVHKFTSVKRKLDCFLLLQNVSSSVGSTKKGQKSIESTKQQIETCLLDSTHIVLTTLGTAGCKALEAAAKFEVVVVDEAAQSVEPSTLVALQLGSSHAILVGDPQQLPATIFSISGRFTKYDRSLFQRLEEAGHEVHLLDTQYRMHPGISEFPRKIFYGGYLKDGPNVQDSNFVGPLHSVLQLKLPNFRPFTIFDLNSSEERDGKSLTNAAEAHFALHLYNGLVSESGHLSTQQRVCIITPYFQQVSLLRRTFAHGIGNNYQQYVDINTIDSFQGREANVIIFSCVRAAGSTGIGFLSDVRRMNVALTRARHYLFVIARCESIVINPFWKQLVNHARKRHAIIHVPVSMGRNYVFPHVTELKTIKPASTKKIVPISKKRLVQKSNSDDSDEEDGEITHL